MNTRTSQPSLFHERRAALWLPFLAALAFSLLFCFVVYPLIASDHHAVLDPDGYGRLGFGLWKNGSLSFYPDTEPTVARGPAYPAFVCLLLTATGGWWPGAIQAAQCVLFAVTVLLTFKTAELLFDRRVAFWAAMVLAMYPLPIWYTSRIWLEILAMFLMTGFSFALVALVVQHSSPAAILAGLMLGIATLCKSTFFPFLVIVPLLAAWIMRGRSSNRILFVIPFIALLTILPWTARNRQVSGHLVLVHTSGTALIDGDYIVDRFRDAPFSYAPHCDESAKEVRLMEESLPHSMSEAKRNYALDKKILGSRLQLYTAAPWLLVRKILANLVLFWTLGETAPKSIVISILLVPLALVFACAVSGTMRWREWRHPKTILLMLVLFYYALHLPINSVGRYAVPLLPLMIVFAAGYVLRKNGAKGGSAP